MKKSFLPILSILLLFSCSSTSQVVQKDGIPAVYSNIHKDADGKLYIDDNGKKYYEVAASAEYKLSDLVADITSYKNGLRFNFNMPEFSGKMYYGFIPYDDMKYPFPVYFKKFSTISSGKTSININKMDGRYDMIGWEKNGNGTIGYRVVDEEGSIVYDGIANFQVASDGFEERKGIIEGPFVNLITYDGATISFTTNKACTAKVEVDGRSLVSDNKIVHELAFSGLMPNKRYSYEVVVGDLSQFYEFTTAPMPGSRTKFSFSYASDSRTGKGGGERDVYGANHYVIKKIMAVSAQRDVKFTQFSGDLINGYFTHTDEMNLQYANWKRAIEPFAHYFPVYISMGNHEALLTRFDDDSKWGISVDKFPFETESSEAIFANNFVNPTNGPESEDGASYDPNRRKVDFPTYKENVFYYTYDNIAVVVMNSNYLYTPPTRHIPLVSGGLHGYIMEQQVKWVEKTIAMLEKDKNIDHVFITEHTPFFPNGGHTRDDMWYGGNNKFRTYVDGKPLQKGILEVRDHLLDLFVNKSTKVRAILTGDEHNYAKTEIGPETVIYPDNYELPKIKLSRTIYQINNGAAGSPYYAQEQVPWTDKATGFTTQTAVVFINVEGESVTVDVVNPDTLEPFESYKLK